MFMKNVLASIREKMIQRYTIEDENLYTKKSTNINILLNRVRQDQKKKNKKKTIIYSRDSIRGCFICFFIFLKYNSDIN